MKQSFRVEKTDKLQGRVTVGGCKNTTLKGLLTFPHLANGRLKLINSATNSQTQFTVDFFSKCGVKTSTQEKVIALEAERIKLDVNLYREVIPQLRHFNRMVIPLITHYEKAIMPLPGYSPYGPRPLEKVAETLIPFGIEVDFRGNNGEFYWPIKERLNGDTVIVAVGQRCMLPTENILRAAVGRRGKTVILNLALDPDIIDIIRLYEKFAPVKFEGISSSKLVVESEGVDVESFYEAEFMVPGDYLEASTIAAAVVAVGGDVVIDGIETERFLPIVPILKSFGADIELGENEFRVTASGKPKATNFTTDRYPGFPTDAQGPFLTVAALAEGQSIIKETIWTNRLTQAAELNRLGAKINLINNQTAIVNQTLGFHGTSVTGTCPRSTAGLLIAGLVAEGETIVSGVDLLRNAYSSLEENLKTLGAKFSLIEENDVTSRHNKNFGRLEAF